MRYRILLACVLGSVGGSSFAQTTIPATMPTTMSETMPTTVPTAVSRLVSQLASDTWRDRQKAQNELVRFGDDAVPALVDVLNHTKDDELRTRARAALAQIEENRATGPSTITIDLPDATVDEVVKELGKQARATLSLNNMNGNPVLSARKAFKVERVSFWGAVREIDRVFGIRPVEWGNDQAMTFVPGNMGNNPLGSPSIEHGPFMIVAVGANLTRSVRFDAAAPVAAPVAAPARGGGRAFPGGGQSDFSVNLRVLCEPKLRILSAQWQPDVSEATDDQGRTLVAQAIPGSFNTSMPGRGWNWNQNVRLSLPAPDAKRLAVLKGVSHFVMQSKSQRKELVNLFDKPHPTATAGGVTLSISDAKRDERADTYSFRFSFNGAGIDMQKWAFVSQQLMSGVRMVDADGRVLLPSKTNENSNGRKYDLTVAYSRKRGLGPEQPGEPAKLIWEMSVETKEVSVPFEFKDLPLP